MLKRLLGRVAVWRIYLFTTTAVAPVGIEITKSCDAFCKRETAIHYFLRRIAVFLVLAERGGTVEPLIGERWDKKEP